MFGNKFEKVVSILLIFLLPTQLGLHFWPDYAFIYGVRVDYLAPTLYLTDLLILSVVIPWIFKKPKLPKISLWILVFILLNIAISTVPWVSLFRWIKITLIFLFGLFIKDRKKVIGEDKIIKAFLVSLIFFSTIGILQFIYGKSFGTEFYLLGARSFNISTPGIALVNYFGQLHIRAYSTFPHPNALAGYLGLGMMFIILNRKVISKKLFILSLLIVGACFIFATSLSACVGLFCVIIILLFPFLKKYLVPIGVSFSLLFPFMIFFYKFDKSYSERIDLAKTSLDIIRKHLFFGVGLNNFIVNSSNKIHQPVHNIFLLMTSELGILGGVSFIVFFTKFLRNKSLLLFVFVFVTSLFDHYWLTSQQNLLLISFTLAMVH